MLKPQTSRNTFQQNSLCEKTIILKIAVTLSLRPTANVDLHTKSFREYFTFNITNRYLTLHPVYTQLGNHMKKHGDNF